MDETGFLKKGVHSAGVGRIENCQVGGFLAYAGPRGHTLVDRELYLPKAWTGDGERLQAVGLASDTPFASKPQLAQRMLVRAIHATLAPADWRRRSAGAGSKGPRWYEWQWVPAG